MSINRLHLVALMLVVVCQQSALCADKPALPVDKDGAPTEAKPEERLEFVKNALLNDPNDQMRVKAAGVLLFSENPDARKFLIDTLNKPKNSAARMAVCKALIQARVSKKTVKNDQDFIEPLLGIFDTGTDAEAQLAADATLIFEYDKIGESLEKIVTDASKPVKPRLNAIYALKLRPDMMATIALIKLVCEPEEQVPAEAPERQVFAAAESALRSLGIPVGKDPETRKEIIDDIKQQGQVTFLRAQLARQDAQMRQTREELTRWRDSYLAALDKIYDNISDDADKSKFLKEHLASTEAPERLWGLEKAYEWRLAPGSKLPDELGLILIKLISDKNRDVRLKTAELLALMTELDSAPRLLARFEAEQDGQVKTKLFVALGGACFSAISSNSSTKISPEIRQVRKKTLEWAEGYLAKDAEKAQIGAKVMKKLLERDGLDPKDVDKYLGLLAKTYNEQENKPAGDLRAELLNAMAGLCARGSTYKAKAAKFFEPLFKEALRDEMDLVRETAVDGLTYVDKTSALKLLRRDFVNDPSAKLREKLIDLADEVGSKDDLNWLADKIGSNSKGGSAWQAMLKIFKGSDAGVLNEWVDKLTSQSGETKLSDEQKIDFLKIAEAKAATENKPEIRRKLADLYYKTGQFERAADCLGRLYEAAQTTEAKEAILKNLVDAYMRGSKVERAAELVEKRLSKADLDPNDVVVRSIDDYLSKPPPGADPNAVLEVLTGIKAPQNRPKWHEWLESWVAHLSKDEVTQKPQEAVKAEDK